jgi:hypothetical protein
LRFGSAECAASVFIDHGKNLFTWQYVRYEDHSPIVSGDEDSAVCNFFDVEFEHST